MKTQLVLGFTLSLFFASANVQAAGPSTGGGGFTVLCPATPLEPARTVLLDLYEAEEGLKFEVMKSSGSIAQDYFGGVNRTYELQGYPKLAEARKVEIDANLKRFFRAVKFVESVQDLPSVDDLGKKPWIPSQCRIQQIAYYDDSSETVYVLQSLWDKLDSLNQAALAIHEMGFRYYRSLGAKDSFNARLFVAHAFSVKGPLPVNDGLLVPTKNYFVHDNGRVTTFTATHGFVLGSPTDRLQFSQIGDYAMLAKTWADISLPVLDLQTQYVADGPVCIVNTPNVNHIATSPLSGTFLQNYYVTLKYITGKPVRLTVASIEGTVLVDNYLSGCR